MATLNPRDVVLPLVSGERLVGTLVAGTVLAGLTATVAHRTHGGAPLPFYRAARPSRRTARWLYAAAALQAGAVAAGAWAYWGEPAWLETTETRIPWAGPALRVVLLADLHARPGGARRIARVVARTMALRPDLILIAGDFVEGLDADPRKLAALAPLERLRAPCGVYAVLGNHDSDGAEGQGARDRQEPIRRCVEAKGIRVLCNEHVVLEGGAALVGVGSFRAHDTDPNAAFAGVSPDAPIIVLAHNWQSLREPGFPRFDLAVAGHTHGGQICVPFTDVCPFLEEDMRPYFRGLYRWPSGGSLYVSRGLGTSEVRARVGARPEIASLRLVPTEQ